MNARHADIILAVLTDKTIRFDRASGAVELLPRASHTTVAQAAAAALAAKPVKRGAGVLVASSDFFNQTVRLPSLQTNGLSKDDLLAALVFEVEPFSNISREQGATAFCAGETISGTTDWHVVQLSNAELGELQNTVRAAGAKAIGFAHAGSELQAATEEELPALMAEWANSANPILTPQSSKLVINPRVVLAVCSLVLTLSVCLAHFVISRARVNALREESVRLKELASINSQLDSANRSLQTKIDAHEKRRVARETAERTSARYRSAWAVLLRSLREACDGTVVLRQIKGDGFFEADITGLSTTEKGPGVYLAKLLPKVREAGWIIQSERQESMTSATGSAPVRFGFHATLDLPEGLRKKKSPAVSYDW